MQRIHKYILIFIVLILALFLDIKLVLPEVLDKAYRHVFFTASGGPVSFYEMNKAISVPLLYVNGKEVTLRFLLFACVLVFFAEWPNLRKKFLRVFGVVLLLLIFILVLLAFVKLFLWVYTSYGFLWVIVLFILLLMIVWRLL